MDKNSLPREKLIAYGAKALRDEELIAVLLRTGTKDQHVLNVSKEVMSLFQNITYLKNITIDDLLSIKGISHAKATTILAAVELGRRVREITQKKRLSLYETSDVYHLLREDMEYLEQEHLIVLCLDIKGNVLKKETIYIGTTTSIPVSIKDLFKSAIKVGAYGIIVVHNHPTGDSTPSLADNRLTEKIKDACIILSIELIDHMIVGKSEFYSYKHQQGFKI